MAFDYASADKVFGACPLCGARDPLGGLFEPLASVDRYGMGIATVGCRGCGLVQTNPRLTAAALASFYASDYRNYYQGIVRPDEAYVRAQRKNVRLDHSTAFLKSAGLLEAVRVVLDVGCSEGAFFAALQRAGVAARFFGIEPNEAFRAYAREHCGAETHASEAELPAGLRGRVDLAVIVHVLEHLADPVASLAHLRAFLAPGGHFYVDVPDVARYRSINDLHIAHVHHFGAETLRATLVAAGYDVVSLESYRPVNHPPSLRAVARAAAGAAAAPVRSAGTEPVRTGWAEVAAIERLPRKPPLRRVVRRWVGSWVRRRAASFKPPPPR